MEYKYRYNKTLSLVTQMTVLSEEEYKEHLLTIENFKGIKNILNTQS